MTHHIIMLGEVVSVAEKAKGYWDKSGLNMNIVVKKCGQMLLSGVNIGAEYIILFQIKKYLQIFFGINWGKIPMKLDEKLLGVIRKITYIYPN